MFLFTGVMLVWSLTTFGAVRPEWSLAVMIAWFSAAALASVWQILKRGRFSLILLGAFLGGGLGMIFLGEKLGLWIFAAFWAWEAASEHPRRVPRFFHFLLLVGMLEAVIGLIQYFVAPGWIFGYLNNQPVSGTLINRNHFAGLLEMLMPVCIGLGFIAVRRYENVSRSYFYVFCGALMALAVAFSLSRMGIFGLFVTILFLSCLLLLRGSQSRLAAGLGLGVTALIVAGVLWIGVDVIIERYNELLKPDAIVEEGRAVVYRDTLRMIHDLPRGVGVAMYADRFRQYQRVYTDLLFDHAHNDYLETLAEWGVLIALPFWILILAAEVQFVRSYLSTTSVEKQGILLACSGSVFAILVHSLADFNLQIPSNAILFFTFIGIGLGIVFRKRESVQLE